MVSCCVDAYSTLCPQFPSGGAVPLERVLPRALLARIDNIDDRMGGGKCGAGASGDEVCGLCNPENVLSAFQICANFRKVNTVYRTKAFSRCPIFSQTDDGSYLHLSMVILLVVHLFRRDRRRTRLFSQVTRADLDLWMLPLFHPQYSRWRRARGLVPIVSSSA